jgi:hypothetical protein
MGKIGNYFANVGKALLGMSDDDEEPRRLPASPTRTAPPRASYDPTLSNWPPSFEEASQQELTSTKPSQAEIRELMAQLRTQSQTQQSVLETISGGETPPDIASPSGLTSDLGSQLQNDYSIS